jgi:DNA (cytosine-5)-methyltransferase 1
LWPAWFRLIEECKPAIIYGEQVTGAITHGWLDEIFSDLEKSGYACAAAVLPAFSIQARHERNRIYFMADFNGIGMEGSSEKSLSWKSDLPERQNSIVFPYQRELLDTFEPKLCRSARGIPNGVAALKCLGNAVIPQVAAKFIQATS